MDVADVIGGVLIGLALFMAGHIWGLRRGYHLAAKDFGGED